MLFGDRPGLARLLRVLDPARVSALVRAENRPQQRSAVEELAAAHALPVLVQPRVDSPAYGGFVENLSRLAPQVIIVDSYSMLLRADVLAIPPLGAVNLHYALLPRYRGPNPIQWALINDEREAGVTLHYMSAEFDSGDLIAQRRVPVHFSDTATDLSRRIDEQAELLLREQLPRVTEGSARRAPQDAAAATTSRRRGPDDGRIDWDLSVLRIYNLIRALVKPLPGAFYELGGERVVIDCRLGIAEVAALKFGPQGRRVLGDHAWRLAGIRGGGDGAGSIELQVAELATGAEVAFRFEIDWEARTGLLDGPGPDQAGAALEIARRFGLDELELVGLQMAGCEDPDR